MSTPADVELIRLWPGRPPGSPAALPRELFTARPPGVQDESSLVEHVARPTLALIRPAKPNGASLLVIPGGGYRTVAIGHEGHMVARWYAAQGFTAYALTYRLPDDGWTPREEASLADAQRAMRVIRARAAAERLDPRRVGLIGFSAGGHLAARLATQSDRRTYDPVDATDRLDARPSAAALIYPVITFGEGTHQGSRDALLGQDRSPARIAAYSAERMVTAATPPIFLATAADDDVVPIGNSLAMLAALRTAKVAAQLHVFEAGGHGFGFRLPDRSESPWPALFLHWSRGHGLVA